MALRREKVSEALPPVSKKMIRGMIPCGLVCAATLVIPQRPFLLMPPQGTPLRCGKTRCGEKRPFARFAPDATDAEGPGVKFKEVLEVLER